MARTRTTRARYEILEWRERRYQFLRKFYGDEEAAKKEARRLNEGYSGPKYVIRRAER